MKLKLASRGDQVKILILFIIVIFSSYHPVYSGRSTRALNISVKGFSSHQPVAQVFPIKLLRLVIAALSSAYQGKSVASCLFVI